ncbi:MAG: thioredoxin [Leptospiraceae bacterium]|nr:thioredoxin [Leptospiraceae bacterium]
MAVTELSDNNFEQSIASALTFVDFWAPWCRPCLAIAPIVEELSNEMDTVKFAKINVDDNQSVAQKFQITSIPTMILFKDGQMVDRVIGQMPKPQLKAFIQKHLG